MEVAIGKANTPQWASL